MKKLLNEYCDENKCAPQSTTIYKNQNIGIWFQYQKGKIESIDDDIYIKLSENEYIKRSLDEYLNPDGKWNALKKLLFEYFKFIQPK